MRDRAVSILFWSFLTVSSLLLFPLAVLLWLVTAPFDPRRAALHRFTCAWAALYTWANPRWRVEVLGRDQIADDGVYVLVSNHASLVDIFALFRLFKHFKFVSKIENFKVPVIGWNMRLNRYISLRRGDKDSVVAMFDHCEQALRGGSSVLIFPEGTRSRTGELREFKSGAFDLALRAKVPIVPIVVQGTRAAVGKGARILPAEIRVTVLAPWPYETFSERSPEEIAASVRQAMADFLATAGSP